MSNVQPQTEKASCTLCMHLRMVHTLTSHAVVKPHRGSVQSPRGCSRAKAALEDFLNISMQICRHMGNLKTRGQYPCAQLPLPQLCVLCGVEQ